MSALGLLGEDQENEDRRRDGRRLQITTGRRLSIFAKGSLSPVSIHDSHRDSRKIQISWYLSLRITTDNSFNAKSDGMEIDTGSTFAGFAHSLLGSRVKKAL